MNKRQRRTLARIIRENRGDEVMENSSPAEPEFIGKADNDASPGRNWFGLKTAV